jgi:hypothetical protein
VGTGSVGSACQLGAGRIDVERGIAWRKSHGGWVTVMGCEVTRECVMMGLHRSFSPFGWAVYVCVNGPE